MAKTVVLEWNDFFKGEIIEKKNEIVKNGEMVLYGVSLGPFAPIAAQLDAIVTPVAYLMLVIATLAAMTGNHSTAIERFKWASLGYLAYHYIPKWLQILGGA